MLLPRNMKQGTRGLAVDMSSADAEKTGERTITKRLGVPGYLPHIVVVMTNMRAQVRVCAQPPPSHTCTL